MGNTGLASILQTLADIAATHAPGYAQCLQPGLSRDELQSKLQQAGFAYQPPQEWFELYQWRNGSAQSKPMFHYHAFMPLDKALSERARMDEANRAHGELYRPDVLPLFDFEGEFYAIECHAEPQAQGRIHFIFHGECLCYDSLHSMLAAKLECHQTRGIYVRDENGHEECADEAACAAILLKHNPIRALPDPQSKNWSLRDAAHP